LDDKEQQRYRIVHDGPETCWLIFDKVENKYLRDEEGKRSAFRRKVLAEARVDELMSLQWIMSANNNDDPDDLDLEVEMESANNILEDLHELEEKIRESENFHTPEKKGFQSQRNQVVLDALVGKVMCSHCTKEYHGPISRDPKFGPEVIHSIKVTRYIGYDTPNLKVDLTCNNCAHTGLYHFNGNPLIDAGIIEKIPL
jgi:hypothetical protein